MNSTIDNTQLNIEDIVVTAVNKAFHKTKHTLSISEWMTLAEGAKYAGVSNNTFMKFREMGLKVCQVDGIKRVSRKEIDKFLDSNSY